MNLTSVDSVGDVVGLLIVYGGSLVAAVSAFILVLRRISGSDAKLDEVREQVSNTHDTNLRDDIDAIRAAIANNHREVRDRLDRQAVSINELSKDVTELRETDRRDRSEGDADHAAIRARLSALENRPGGQP